MKQPYCHECKAAWLAARKGRISYHDRETTPLILAPEIAAYVAGIVDGEGSITLNVRADHSPGTLIAVGNTDCRLTDWLHRQLGGNVRLMHPENRLTNRRAVWHWQLWAIEARRLLRTVMPYLVIKQRHAEIVLAFHQAILALHRTQAVTPPYGEPFASLFGELKLLNRKGPRDHPPP